MGLIYLDSSVVIHLTENPGTDGKRFADAIVQRVGDELAVSPLVRLECLVVPIRNVDLPAQRYYESELGRYVHLTIDNRVFETATEVRARFNVKTPDALHIATALTHNCAAIWTTDERMSRVARALGIGTFVG